MSTNRLLWLLLNKSAYRLRPENCCSVWYGAWADKAAAAAMNEQLCRGYPTLNFPTVVSLAKRWLAISAGPVPTRRRQTRKH